MGKPLVAELSSATLEHMIRVRRTIHQHPELSRQEQATRDLVQQELESAGIQAVERIAGTGLKVDIQGGPGRTLLLRADMDALPIQEDRPDLPFASRHAGVMHACGHDVHTAILLRVTLSLNEIKEQLPGTVRCIFQPSEEAEPLGGREIVESGALDGVDAALALHVDPDLDAGAVGLKQGALLAGGMEFTITVNGNSSHAARPHLGVDTICAAASIIQELQKIPGRRIDPLEPAVVTIGKIHGGTAKNIIADKTIIEGTVRALSEPLRQRLRALVTEVAETVARANGASAAVEMASGEPVLENDPDVVALVRDAARALLNPDQVIELDRGSMGSEDFAFYTKAVPGAMFRLGVRSKDEPASHPLHHPKFYVDESALGVGAAAFIEATKRFLNR